MTLLDRLVQRIRVNKAKPHIPRGARLLDVGSADGHLPRELRLAHGMDLESRRGYDLGETPRHFSGFRVARDERFELGMNHLFALER